MGSTKTTQNKDPYCREVPREECRLVEKEVCVPVARPVEKVVTRDQCRDEPVTQCRFVTKARPQKKCLPVDVEKCRWVVRLFKQEVHQQVSSRRVSVVGSQTSIKSYTFLSELVSSLVFILKCGI